MENLILPAPDGTPLAVRVFGAEEATRGSVVIGAAMGDPTNWGIIQGMIVEALTVVLMLASWWALSRPAEAPVATADGGGLDEASR